MNTQKFKNISIHLNRKVQINQFYIACISKIVDMRNISCTQIIKLNGGLQTLLNNDLSDRHHKY